MSVRIAKGLYASPKSNPRVPPSGGLDLARLVKQAAQAARFHNLFGQPTTVVDLVQNAVQQHGWQLPRTEVLEAVEEFA